ncbi:MAG: DUF2817 domain-containing protein [Sedimentisphaerales bacterium]|nr:DUF2817 domain-containing protein [Sedimentisphaerales bacterium]
MNRLPLHLALLLALVLVGCRSPQPQNIKVTPVTRLTPPLSPQEHIFGYSVENRPITYLLLGHGPNTCLIMATIHGNEQAGTPLLLQLIEHLQQPQNAHLLAGRQLVIVPVANPDGVAHNRRFNSRGIDLNRNFPADNRRNTKKFGQSALSEPESTALYQLIDQYHPSRIVTIHQPLNCIDYDGPAQHLAEQMAMQCNLPIKKLGSRPGSLGSYAGNTLNIPIITLEFPRSDDNLSPQQLFQTYSPTLLTFIKYK